MINSEVGEVEEGIEEDDFPWYIGIYDAHCHPTDTMSAVPDISKMHARALVVMSTRSQDQALVAGIAEDLGLDKTDKEEHDGEDWRGIVPSFGWHPWFAHHLYDEEEYKSDGTKACTFTSEDKIKHYQDVLTPRSDNHEFLLSLPEPQSIGHFLSQTEERLRQHPLALIGEVGLDKAFRIPQAWLPRQLEDRDDSLTPGGREGRSLSPYRVSINHQRKVVLAQLKLAGRMQRAVSMHGVQAHGQVYDVLHDLWKGHEKRILSKRELKRTHRMHPEDVEATNKGDPPRNGEFPPRLCLHSFSGTPEMIKQYVDHSVPIVIFFSFSLAVNFSSRTVSKIEQTEQVIKSLPRDRLLVESDLHVAGERMDESLKEMTQRVCNLRGWALSEGVEQLAKNWKAFVFGIGLVGGPA